MEAGNVANGIPFTAWEQAVFVALFIVMVGALLYWFSRQSKDWQKFIAEINDKWQRFSEKQRQENNDAMAEVKDAVGDLTTVTQGLINEVREMREASQKFYEHFEAHDRQAASIAADVARLGRDRRSAAK